MPDAIDMPESEWKSLDWWQGLDYDDEPGMRYRAQYAMQPYLITIKQGAEGRYSSSQLVNFKGRAA